MTISPNRRNASEICKARVHRGLAAGLGFFRDRKGNEVDVVVELGRELLAVEIKSGQTIADDFFAGLRTFAALGAAARPRRRTRGVLVYGGDTAQDRADGTVVPWSALDRQAWWDA